MDVKILKKEENKLYNRYDVEVLIEHKNEATPKRLELKKKIAAMLGVDENLVIIDKIRTEYGKQISLAYVRVYNDKNTLYTIEPKYLLKRNNIQ